MIDGSAAQRQPPFNKARNDPAPGSPGRLQPVLAPGTVLTS
jgi:hypothetical protein